MASFAPIRGTKAQINNTPIVDGQFLIETDQDDLNKIYLDNGSVRIYVGGKTIQKSHIIMDFGDTLAYPASFLFLRKPNGQYVTFTEYGNNKYHCYVEDFGTYDFRIGDSATTPIFATLFDVNCIDEYTIKVLFDYDSNGLVVETSNVHWYKPTFTPSDTFIAFQVPYVTANYEIYYYNTSGTQTTDNVPKYNRMAIRTGWNIGDTLPIYLDPDNIVEIWGSGFSGKDFALKASIY